MYIDVHTHCRFSMDSQAEPEENVRIAIERGVKVLAFTDHVDRVDNALDYTFDFDEYVALLKDLREKYKKDIDLLIGIEMGLNVEMNHLITPTLKDDRFDCFIGSLHTLDDEDIASSMANNTAPLAPYYMRHYESMLENVQNTTGFHTLGHMDYLDRYVPDKSKIPAFDLYKDVVAEILREVIKRDLAIEYNTGGFFKGLDYANPKDDILMLYKDLGGKRIATSSDAHRSKDIARGFEQAYAHLASLGFHTLTYFKDKCPIDVPLL